jgi:hypothetical protein
LLLINLYTSDSDGLITAKQATYRFNLFPVFWTFLSKKLADGVVRFLKLVYEELVTNVMKEDELARWAKARRRNGLCVSASKKVQEACTKVADYVKNNPRYGQPAQAKFLGGADPWLIAHAIAEGGAVVTQETRVSPDSKQVRIPDVCAYFKVRCINTCDMLEELGFRSQCVRVIAPMLLSVMETQLKRHRCFALGEAPG